jgi:hypothetical protein
MRENLGIKPFGYSSPLEEASKTLQSNLPRCSSSTESNRKALHLKGLRIECTGGEG